MINFFYKDLNTCLNNDENLYKYHGLLNFFLLNNSTKKDIIDYSQKRNKEYIREANKISNVLSDKGIKHVFLKSMSIITDLYSSPSEKRFGDIDILVDKSQLEISEKIFCDLDYQYGIFDYDKKKIIIPDRKEIVSRKMFSHQTYEMCKYKNNIVYNLDINYLFQWKENDSSSIDLKYLLSDCTEFYADGLLKIFRFKPLINFIHMCCHYYNEAVFFMHNDYYIGKDPKELKLSRILDIVLMYEKYKFNILEMYSVSKQFGIIDKVSYCLKIINTISPRYLNDKILEKFDVLSSNVDMFYDDKFNCRVWDIPLLTRLNNPNIKMNFLKNLEIANE
ncbi:nucleotidyltransferase family protein [Staphylococcus nepalensis]|uniref:nucleotidyltransferase family protein n=1 Tax=Staphylococcus nepalensis TaxID=214473 RepID=UPI0024BB5AB2|nr:nucleotidyltransferase family protein [Staphylococcus nepalensis]